jgi:hypothetical protein
MALVRLDFPEATPADVERFWDELVPLIAATTRTSFDALPETKALVEQRFTRKQRRVQYRLLARFGLILLARLEPLYHHRGLKPLIPVRTNFHLAMLAHHVIGCGREAYLKAVQNPESVVEHVPALTPHTGLYALGVFRFEAMTFDAQKLRLLERYFYPHDAEKKRQLNEKLKLEDLSSLPKPEQVVVGIGRAAFAFFSLLPHLRDGFRGPAFERGYPELYPTFTELETGEVIVGGYTPLPPGTEVAPDLKSLPLPN